MAQDNKISKWKILYEDIEGDYALPEYDTFKANMERPGKEGDKNRKELFDMIKDTYDVGETYEEFSQRMGLHAVSPGKQPKQTKAAATSTTQTQGKMQATANRTPSGADTSRQAPGWDAINDTIRRATNPPVNDTLDEIDAIINGRTAQTAPATTTDAEQPFKYTPEIEEQLGEMQYGVASTNARMQQQSEAFAHRANNTGKKGNTVTGERKFNPETGKTERVYYTKRGEEAGSALERAARDFDDWELYTPEGRKHYEQRMQDDFDRRIGAVMDKYDPENAAEQVWQLADAKTLADQKKNNVEQNYKNTFGVSRESQISAAYYATHSFDVSYLTYHDLQRMADDAWDNLGDRKQQAIIDDCREAIQIHYPNATPEEAEKMARQLARQQSDQRMFNLAVAKNAPKSATDYFFRKVIGQNSLAQIFKAKVRKSAGTTGDWEARDVAESEFEHGWKNKTAGIAGTVVGFMVDPLTYIGGLTAKGATMGAMGLAGRLLGGAAKRKFATSLGGRITLGMVGGGANFGTYEAGSEALNQLRWGGKVTPNKETGRYEIGDYSGSAIAGQFGHGVMMGSATGWLAPTLGNVSDKLVRATESTVGKAGLRLGELGVSTVAEGTVFSVPEWIEGDRDAMDVWTDNLAMMAGFKGSHIVKSAPGRIAELAGSKGGKAGFETRLRSVLDGRSDLALTDDEREELRRGGYSDLSELVDEYKKYEEYNKAQSAKGKPTVSTENKGKPTVSTENKGKPTVSTENKTEVNIPGTNEGAAEGAKGSATEGELPYNRFSELMKDETISEAARAKMYYYITGKTLPMSTIIGYSTTEHKDPEGTVTGYTVQSLSGKGVVTSRNFKTKERADVEVDRIKRQAELNAIDIGEQNFDVMANNRRMYEACKSVAEETGAPVHMLYEMMTRKPESLSKVERQWAEKIYNAYEKTPDDDISHTILNDVKRETGIDVNEALKKKAKDRTLQEEAAIQMANAESRRLRIEINRKYGVDVDKAIGKEPNRRNEQEQTALDEYFRKLYSEKSGKQEEGAEAVTDPTKAKESQLIAAMTEQEEDEGVPLPYKDRSAAFKRGYNASLQRQRDIAIGLDVTNPNSPEYAELEKAWNGVQQRIKDIADYAAAELHEELRMEQHADGSLRPATLKENDKTVYIVEGNVQMMEDGTMVDPEKSDKSIVIYDPTTGERRMIDPTADTGIRSLGDVTSAELLETSSQHTSRLYELEGIDRATGTISLVYPGKKLKLPTGEDVTVRAVEGDKLTVTMPEGEETTLSLSGLRKETYEAALADYKKRHNIADTAAEETATTGTENKEDTTTAPTTGADEAKPGEDTPEYDNDVPNPGDNAGENAPGAEARRVEGAPSEYTEGTELTIRDAAGEEKPAMVMGRVRYEKGRFVPDEQGAIVEYLMDGEVHHDHISDLTQKVVAHTEPQAPEAPSNDGRGSGEPATERQTDVPQTEEVEPIGQFEKKNSALSNTTDTGKTHEGNGNDTATPESTVVSADKVTGNSENVQGGGENSQLTALQRLPKDEKGEPIFEKADSPEAAWDALVEYCEGDAEEAKEIAERMVEEKKKALDKAQKLKNKGNTPATIRASKKANDAAKAQAQAEYELWQNTAAVERKRQEAARAEQEAEARRQAVELAAAEKVEQEAREEAARKERVQQDGDVEQGNQRNEQVENFDRRIPKTAEEAKGMISRLVELAKKIKDKVNRIVVGGLTERQTEDLKAKGVNVDETWVHSVENSAIIHNQQQHGDQATEDKKGQIAITESDYQLIPDILESYDEVNKSDHKDAQGNDVIIYTKAYPDGTVYYLEEVRNKRKSLAFRTMYKKKNSSDSSDGLMQNASPLTPKATPDNLNAVSDGKVTENSDVAQENEGKSLETYLQGKSKMKQGRERTTLETLVKRGDKAGTRAWHIENAIKVGLTFTESANNGKAEYYYTMPDGVEYVITKTEYEYAKYLGAKTKDDTEWKRQDRINILSKKLGYPNSEQIERKINDARRRLKTANDEKTKQQLADLEELQRLMKEREGAVQKQAAGETRKPTPLQRKLGEALVRIAKKFNGIKVVTDTKEMQEVLNKSLSKIWQHLSTRSENLLAASSKDDAKVAKIIDSLTILAKKYRGKTDKRGAITDFADAIGAKGDGASKYVAVKMPNGAEAVIRISNHNADARTFADRGHLTENISIVFKPKYSKNRFKADNGVELTEYVYTAEAIAKDGNLLSQVAESLADMLQTGKYVDKSGKALVNTSPLQILQKMTVLHGSRESHEQFLKTKEGEVYGFVKDGTMYIDPALLNPNTPIHEYGHLWTNALMKAQPELWSHGKNMMKKLPLWEEVRGDENYADIRGNEDLVASEVFSRLLGADGEKKLDDMVNEAKAKGDPIEVAETVTLAQRIREWLKSVLMQVRSAFGHKWTAEEAKTVTLDELKGMALKDFAEGVNLEEEVHKADEGEPAGAIKESEVENRPQFRFIGERGAENIDKAEQATRMRDNLNVAREMEKAYKELEGNPKERERLQDAAKAVRELKAEKSENYPTTREDAEKAYKAIGKATNAQTGVEVEFFGSAFNKNHREGGLFEKAIPALKKAFENSVLIFSDTDKRSGQARPDGTTHKEHRSIRTFDDYVGKVNIDGKDYYVRYTVQMQPGQNGVHSQFVTNVELYDTKNPTNVASYRDSSLPARLDVNGISDAKLQRFFALASGNAHDFAKAVKFATGWERGADGKWRYEQADGEIIEGAKLEERKSRSGIMYYTSTLGKIFDAPDLYKAYPQLKDMEVVFQPMEDGISGSFNGENIVLSDEYARTNKGKNQDRINEIEATPEYKSYKQALDDTSKIEDPINEEAEFDRIDNEWAQSELGKEYNELLNGNRLTTTSVGRVSGEARSVLIHEVQHAIQHIEGFARGGNPEEVAKERLTSSEVYRRLGGEVEARNAQSRRDMTDEERRASLASETEDVARDEQIFLQENGGASFSKISDEELTKRLEKEPKVKVYRAMQLIDGKLYPPMAARIKGEDGKKQLVEPIELGKWEQADEHPELIDKNGKFVLDKANGSTVPAAYNPYIHTSRSPLNDQFSSAYNRPNLVTVEVEVPVSELTSGYKAEHAKDAVGEVDWKSGPVSSKLAKAGDPRKVILSRYDKPVRIIPDAEVAENIAKKLEAAEAKTGERISIPANTVTPSLRAELEKRGVSVEDTKETVREASLQDDRIRFRFIGERGAENIDKAEQATRMRDNLNVAREMEKAYKEKKERIEKLKKSEPVEITGEEIAPSEDLKQYRKNANEYGLKNLRGEYTNKDTGNKITVVKNSVKEVTSHDASPAQFQSVAAIPQILENGIYIDTLPNEDTAKHGDVVSYDYYVCGLKIGGIDYTVKAVVLNGVNGERYYDHRLTEIEKGKLISLTDAMQNHASESNSPLSAYKDKRLLSILQTNDTENARRMKIATGWERGADGKWRYEEPDLEVAPDVVEKLSIRDKEYHLEELLSQESYERLIKTYPEFKDTVVHSIDFGEEYGGAYYSRGEIAFNINAANVKTMYGIKRALVHEIQHGIQAIEGFEGGDDPSYARERYEKTQTNIKTAGYATLRTAAGIRRKAERLIESGKYKRLRIAVRNVIGNKAKKYGYEPYGVIESLATSYTYKELRDASENVRKHAIEQGDYERLTNSASLSDTLAEREYMRNAGEVEARNAEKRLGMSDEMRRSTLAEETEDVARDEQIFLQDALGGSNAKESNRSYDVASQRDNEAGKGYNEEERGIVERAKLDGAVQTSAEAKRGHAERLAQTYHTPIRIVEDVNELTHSNSEIQEKMRKNPGYFDPKTGEVVVVLPNNKDVEDVAATVFHEVVAHRGLRELIGEENYGAFCDEVYKHLNKELKGKVDTDATRRFMDDPKTELGEHRRVAVDEMFGHMAEKGFEDFTEAERGIWAKLKRIVLDAVNKFLGTMKLPKWVTLGDNELRYMLWRSHENLRRGKEHPIDVARDIVKQEETRLRFRESEAGDIWNDKSMGLQERITAAKIRLAANHQNDKQLRDDAIRAISGNLTDLRKAMSGQRKFDKATVKRVADLARMLIETGYMDGVNRQETKRLLSAVKNSVGNKENAADVQKVMDIMVDNQLRNAKAELAKLLSIKGSKVDARGVEVQGRLDVAGQRTMKVVKDAMGLSEDDINERIAEAANRMSDPDQTIADEAALDYTGLHLALEYAQNIAGSKAKETALRESIKTAKEEKDAGRMSAEAYKEFVEAAEDAIRKNKTERIEAYSHFVGRLSDSLRESIENAKAFREAEKKRIGEIHHNANSDMEGRPANEHHKEGWQDNLANNDAVRFLLQPLATFDQILRVFGNKSANGEGYLWNRYMRGWVDCRNKELTGIKDKYAQLDAKAAEVFGKKVKSWGDLIRMASKLPKANLPFMDGGVMRDHQLTQGNFMYVYMVNKMTDGRMKLRKMGITESSMAYVEQVLDPRLKEIGDWLQEEFLVQTRNEYNETHKRMFGASMAAIEDYFPLKILENARYEKEEDVNQPDRTDGITTATGAIKKRSTNVLSLDITGADALTVVLDHIIEMEHWNAFAEWNRDLNTLRTYKRFRNQVLNMTTTAYGGGRELWKNFNDLCLIAAGQYKPKHGNFDKTAVNIAKGVTAAKVSFRVFTALKQFLSAPAYIPEVSISSIAKSLVNPYGDFKWCMENLPVFAERWGGRMSGDPRLLKTDKDWKMWRSRAMELSSRIGMTPNAFVDALTICIGAKAMYETRKKQYLREGYGEDAAEKRAKEDATILYNQSQQSSEAPFLSPMQVDRTWGSVVFSVFRNSPFSYTRQEYDALRNLKRNLTPGQRAKSVEFTTKQILRDWGVEEENATEEQKGKARRAAKSRFNRQIRKDVLRVATYGYILELTWNLGAYLPYIIFGKDEDEKDKMWDDAITHAYFGSVEGLAGGDVMSSFGNMAVSGEWSANQLGKNMPISSDITNIVNKFMGDKEVEAVNDIINLVVQSGIGMNPQSITDMVVAIMDACGDDPATSREAAMLIMRILQTPQSQLDKIYFDEIGLSGDEASKYTPEQLAQRYAEYKVKRGNFHTPWVWDDEERLENYKEKAYTKIKERVAKKGDPEVNEAYADLEARYNAVNAKVKEAKELMRGDYVAGADAFAALEKDPDISVYRYFKLLDKHLTNITKKYFGAQTPEEAELAATTMNSYRAGMVKVLQAEDEESRDEALTELMDILNDFNDKYGGEQQPDEEKEISPNDEDKKRRKKRVQSGEQ